MANNYSISYEIKNHYVYVGDTCLGKLTRSSIADGTWTLTKSVSSDKPVKYISKFTWNDRKKMYNYSTATSSTDAWTQIQNSYKNELSTFSRKYDFTVAQSFGQLMDYDRISESKLPGLSLPAFMKYNKDGNVYRLEQLINKKDKFPLYHTVNGVGNMNFVRPENFTIQMDDISKINIPLYGKVILTPTTLSATQCKEFATNTLHYDITHIVFQNLTGFTGTDTSENCWLKRLSRLTRVDFPALSVLDLPANFVNDSKIELHFKEELTTPNANPDFKFGSTNIIRFDL